MKILTTEAQRHREGEEGKGSRTSPINESDFLRASVSLW